MNKPGKYNVRAFEGYPTSGDWPELFFCKPFSGNGPYFINYPVLFMDKLAACTLANTPRVLFISRYQFCAS